MNKPAPNTTSDATQAQPAQPLAERLNALYQRINYERQIKVSPDGFRLQSMREQLRRLGDPHLACPVIHVAGTKGKGSVSTMCGSILTEAGCRVGVYTSPHLETIHQRMAIDRQPINDQQLLEILETIQPIVAAMDEVADPATDPTLTFFEITTAAAMLFFARQKVDYVVLEVGLGGRLDSTNVCQPQVCVITNISFDHTRQLGKTIDRIAREKAGIIKPGVPVVSGALNPEAAAAITEVAQQKEARLYQLGQDFQVGDDEPSATDDDAMPSFSFRGRFPGDEKQNESNPDDQELVLPKLQVGLPGAHQRTNAALAVAAVSLLNESRVTPAAIEQGLRRTRMSGRTEIVSQRPLVVLDIAHNPASAAALAQALASELAAWKNAQRRVLIFATSRDKDAGEMLKSLAAEADEVWLTEYQTNPRAFELSELSMLAEPLAGTVQSLQTAATPVEAWDGVLRGLGPTDAVCIAGSAFLIAELRPTVLRWADSH
jgi:dihydrofolate synthase/folylpolyglutamate synthase